MKTNKHPVERIYLDDKRVKPQTIAHHVARYKFAVKYLVMEEHKGEVTRFTKRQRVLDLGCGTGYGSDMLSKYGASVVGVDVSDIAITFARDNYPQCKFGLANVLVFLQRAKENQEKYDLITFFEVIEHISFAQGKEIVRLIHDVLTENGIFFLSTPKDTNGKYNTFHKSEWTYEILKNELGSIFGDVEIRGQDWDTAKITRTHVRENDFYICICKK